MNIFRQLFQLIIPTGNFCWYNSLPPEELLAYIKSSHSPPPPNNPSIQALFLVSEPHFLTSVSGHKFTLEAVQKSRKLYFTGAVSEHEHGSILQGTFVNKGDRLFSAIGYAVVGFGYLALVISTPQWLKDYSDNPIWAGLIYLLLGMCVPRMRFHSSKQALLEPVKELLQIQEQSTFTVAASATTPC
jgi:hypothetical protein